MNLRRSIALAAVLLAVALPVTFYAANHREAPITALDHKADIADFFAFVSYDDPSKVTFILDVDPLLEPANGPTLFPFDPEILYAIKIDNNHNARPDVIFQFRFQTEEFQLPGVYTAVAGIGDEGAVAPGTRDLVVPPRITSFDSPGLNLRQTYTVTLIRDGVSQALTNPTGDPLYAVPGNAGPRTMDYGALFDAATYPLDNEMQVFAGTVDDPFWIDLGAAFDTFNIRTLGSGVPGVLTDTEDGADQNFASDTVSGYAVNAIAIEVPISMIKPDRRLGDNDTIGAWGTTSRLRQFVIPGTGIIPGAELVRQV